MSYNHQPPATSHEPRDEPMTHLHIKIKDTDKAIADLFGVWEKRDVCLGDIRKKAWMKNHGNM